MKKISLYLTTLLLILVAAVVYDIPGRIMRSPGDIPCADAACVEIPESETAAGVLQGYVKITNRKQGRSGPCRPRECIATWPGICIRIPTGGSPSYTPGCASGYTSPIRLGTVPAGRCSAVGYTCMKQEDN